MGRSCGRIFINLIIGLRCFGEYTFYWSAWYGDLGNMKWLYEKGCPWGEGTFSNAYWYGDLDNMKWLYEKGCPWGKTTIEKTTIERCCENHPAKENIIRWMQEHGCP